MQNNDPRQRFMRVEWAARVASPDLSNAGLLPQAAANFEIAINNKLAELAKSNFNLTGAHTVGPMLVMLGQRVTPVAAVSSPQPAPPIANPEAITYLYLDEGEVKSREFDSIDEAKKQIAKDMAAGLKPFAMHLTSVTSLTTEQIAELVKDS